MGVREGQEVATVVSMVHPRRVVGRWIVQLWPRDPILWPRDPILWPRDPIWSPTLRWQRSERAIKQSME